jgi:transcription-repair coupling factor (superfamily II helicase)
MNTLLLLRALADTPSAAALLAEWKKKPAAVEIEGPEGAASAMLAALLAEGPALAVVPTDGEASALAADFTALGFSPLVFPWWGTVPYREASPLSAVFTERAGVLSALMGGSAGLSGPCQGGPDKPGRVTEEWNGKRPPLCIACERAFLSPLPPPAYFRDLLVTLRPGDSIDRQALAAALTGYGYTRVPRVQLPGEFALRGEVLDVFSGGEEARRVLFDFDRVELVKSFDPQDQAAGDKLDLCVIRPLKEVVWTDERIAVLEKNLAEAAEFARGGAALAAELRERRSLPGEELLFPLAFEKPATLLDYLAACASGSGGAGTAFYFETERLSNAAAAFRQEYQGLFRQAAREREVPAPERILLDFDAVSGAGTTGAEVSAAGTDASVRERPRSVFFMSIHGEGRGRHIVPCDPPRSFFGNIEYLKEEFAALTRQNWTVVIAAESGAQARRIRELLRLEESADAAAPAPGTVSVITAPFSAGFALSEAKLILVQENEIFGRRRRRAPRPLAKGARLSPIDTFVELNPGDYVVHINYGIGLFKGIERINALGHERDYVKLEYLEGETIFVPIEQVDLVQRYIGHEGVSPRLDKIGSKSWESRKGRVRKSVEELAQRLIALYSRRRAAPGFAFPKETEWQNLFEAAFPFEETDDQLRCVEEIKIDMESPRPMDRLVCGDVGYGKTEVALRACFKAIMGGRQAAFLCPTTILAEQHYNNFVERFSQFPVRIAILSRFVTPARARRVIAAMAQGEIDLLVGTHRILQNDVTFKNLGLVVIDEEQRFGVKDKERLKELKASIDCLTLSATPIPRTLHMSLLKIRDMSLLATPPLNRHPIETVIGEFSEERIAEAVRREAARGGQVFFLHNRIETLKDTRIMLERIVPEMTVETAHGKMNGRDLEDIMRRFIHGGFHVLVSTTIIENGIDIPNVNTIIIDRADMYGVSQLYQLRGRVGRSDRVAQAYLLYPAERSLSELAMRRLQAISDFTELGSGFKIALKDMEIRGAGNLLGREQSGDIYSVGFDLYVKLLDEAVRRLESGGEHETETLLELEYSGFIPDSWIDGPQEKMEVYKKIAAVKTAEELDALHEELAGRFGPPPADAASLLSLAEIRIICRSLAVCSLREQNGLVRVEFAKVSGVNVDRLLRLMRESSGRVRLDPTAPNVIILKTGKIGLREKSEFIREKLSALAE